MSFIDILRTRGFWAALAVSAAVLLILWGVCALLIVNGTMSQDVLSGWICGSYLLAGLTGGVLAGRRKTGGMTIALTLAALLICISILTAWVMYGGVSFSEGGWKNMLFIVLGAALAGMLTARKGKMTMRKRAARRR